MIPGKISLPEFLFSIIFLKVLINKKCNLPKPLQNNKVFLFIYWLYNGKILWYSNDMWLIKDILTGEEFYFPQLQDNRRLKKSYYNKLKSNYFYTDLIQLKKGDIVFDIGAYIGMTSKIASRKALKVYSIEPSPRALKCLERNTKKYENITILPYAVWKNTQKIDLQLGISASEDGLLKPDDGGIGKNIVVQAYSIKDLVDMVDLEKIDFLKIEAEGVEPEIVKSLSELDIPVNKISVACGPERDGKTVDKEVIGILSELGYIVKRDNSHGYNMVHARLK